MFDNWDYDTTNDIIHILFLIFVLVASFFVAYKIWSWIDPFCCGDISIR